jgi:hypothetical protein
MKKCAVDADKLIIFKMLKQIECANSFSSSAYKQKALTFDSYRILTLTIFLIMLLMRQRKLMAKQIKQILYIVDKSY